MNLPRPLSPPIRRPARARAGTASWPCASARSPPASSTISCAALARAALALILNGNTEAGAAKLAAYAFIAGGIQSFLMRLSPRLGFMALLCSTLTLLGVLVAWNLLPRIADGLFYGASLWLALAGLTYAGWRRGAHRADSAARAPLLAGHQRAGPVAGGLRWCCARWFSESRTARARAALPRQGTQILMKFDDASWHYEGDYPADLPESAAATHIGMFLAWALLHGMAGEELIDDSAEALAALQRRELTGAQFLITELDEN